MILKQYMRLRIVLGYCVVTWINTKTAREKMNVLKLQKRNG